MRMKVECEDTQIRLHDASPVQILGHKVWNEMVARNYDWYLESILQIQSIISSNYHRQIWSNVSCSTFTSFNRLQLWNFMKCFFFRFTILKNLLGNWNKRESIEFCIEAIFVFADYWVHEPIWILISNWSRLLHFTKFTLHQLIRVHFETAWRRRRKSTRIKIFKLITKSVRNGFSDQ